MNRVEKSTWAAVVLGVATWFASAAPAPGADRSAEQILKELDAVKAPVLDATKKVGQEDQVQKDQGRRLGTGPAIP